MITYPKRSIYLDLVQYKKGDLGVMHFRTLIKDSIIYHYTYIALLSKYINTVSSRNKFIVSVKRNETNIDVQSTYLFLFILSIFSIQYVV